MLLNQRLSPSLTLAPAGAVKVTVASGTLRSSRHGLARPMARGDLVTQPGLLAGRLSQPVPRRTLVSL